MKRRFASVTLALIAACAVSGCGQDNNDNEGGIQPTVTPTAVRTATPVVTATPTVPVETPTGGTPVPTATTTPGPGGDCQGEGSALTITVTSQPGSTLDTGWTGISHDQTAIDQAQVTTNLDCTGDDCTIDGSALAGTNFGSPLPLSSGGVAVCVINTFREGVTGTYNCATGCSESSVKLTSFVIQSAVLEKPCPKCEGDPTPNDGLKQGTCDSGKAPGAPCDVGGISPTFGPTSNDCLPSASSVGELAIDLVPLTTGTVTRAGDQPCVTSRFGSTCYCPGQDRPNACTDGVCPPSGFCDDPVDGFCSGQKFRVCDLGSGTSQCEDTFPGAGSCETFPRPCFGDTISRTGTCGTQSGTLVAFFCIPPTRAPAINTVAGLPGPGVVSLPGTVVRQPR